MRLEGNTVRQIAEALNVSVGAAAQYLQETLAELRAASQESAESWRQLQLDRLDTIIAAWLPVARDPAHPEAARGAAIVVRACDSQARLLGLLQADAVPQGPEAPKEPAKSLVEQFVESPALLHAAERQIACAKERIRRGEALQL